jgi:hypothetical protein
VRRAGAAWNRHDEGCLCSALTAARSASVPSVLAEYGGLRLWFDLVPKEVTLAEVRQTAAMASGGGDGDVEMQDGLSETAGGPARDATAAAAATAASSTVPPAEATTVAADLARLQAKESRRREAKRRQRRSRRERDAEAKAAAASAAAPSLASAFTFGASSSGVHKSAPAPAAGGFAFNFKAAAVPAACAPAASSAGASIAPCAAPAAPPAGTGAFAMGAAGPSCAAACPAARTAATGQKQGPPVYAAAFGGHMPTATAHARLAEAVTATCTARGPCVPRTCLIPGGVRLELMVLGSSRAAHMSESDLGSKLASGVDGGLTYNALAELVDWLCDPPATAAPDRPCAVPLFGPARRCGSDSGRSLFG